MVQTADGAQQSSGGYVETNLVGSVWIRIRCQGAGALTAKASSFFLFVFVFAFASSSLLFFWISFTITISGKQDEQPIVSSSEKLDSIQSSPRCLAAFKVH